MVSAEGVHKRFGRLEVLKGITLRCSPGEVMCLLGPSGSGKSTFLRCINHLEKINAGRLSVDGELVGYRQVGDKLHELRESEVARKRAEIGMVFQHFNLFPHMTALENVTCAPIRVEGVSRDAGAPASDRAARPRRPRGQARRLPGAALGRAAAARGDRARARDGAEADALRRADLGARPRAGGRGARGDAAARARRDDDGRRHPRDRLRARGRRHASCSWTAAWSSSPAPRRRCSATRSTSARARSCRRSSRAGAQPRCASRRSIACGRFARPIPEAHVARLLVDVPGQQQHAGVLGDLLAPAAHVDVRAHPREADRPGRGAHPLELPGPALEQIVAAAAGSPAPVLRLRSISCSLWRSASATSSSLGALEQIVVYSFSSRIGRDQRGVAAGEPADPQARQAVGLRDGVQRERPLIDVAGRAAAVSAGSCSRPR